MAFLCGTGDALPLPRCKEADQINEDGVLVAVEACGPTDVVVRAHEPCSGLVDLVQSGEDLLLDEHRNYSIKWDEQITGLERVADRAGMKEWTWTRWPSFINRDDGHYVQHTDLVKLAMAFAAAEQETVNLYIDLEEKKRLREGFTWGEIYQHRELLNRKPAGPWPASGLAARRGGITLPRKPSGSGACSGKRSTH